MHLSKMIRQAVYFFAVPLLFAVPPLVAQEQKHAVQNYSCNLDEFRDKLARKLNDLDRLSTIIHAYKHLTRRVQLSHENWKNLEKWLINKSMFIGCLIYS